MQLCNTSPGYYELGLWEKKNELDVTIRGFVILPLLYRTEDAFTVYCSDVHKEEDREKKDTEEDKARIK